MKTYADELFALAQLVADETEDFHTKKGPGAGDKASTVYLKKLNKMADELFGIRCRQQESVCDGTKLTFDFYFPSEKTAVEIALSLANPHTEFERDIFKALLANDAGKPVVKLMLIGRPGSVKRHNRGDSLAIAKLVKAHYDINIQVRELTL